MDDIKMCSKCDYNWTKYEWEHGKGHTEKKMTVIKPI